MSNQATEAKPKPKPRRDPNRMHPSDGGRIVSMCPRKFRYNSLDETRKPTKGMVAGTLLHAFVLGGDKIVPVPFNDLKSAAARKCWADALAEGATPCMQKDYPHYSEAAARCATAIEERFGKPPTFWEREKLMRWKTASGARAEGTTDLVVQQDGQRTIVEVKLTTDIASFSNRIREQHYHVQRAAYIEGQSELFPSDYIEHVFLVVEATAPYCLRWVGCDPMAAICGENMWYRAGEIFQKCMKEDNWPDWEPTVHEARGHEIAEWGSR